LFDSSGLTLLDARFLTRESPPLCLTAYGRDSDAQIPRLNDHCAQIAIVRHVDVGVSNAVCAELRPDTRATLKASPGAPLPVTA
jgi:hypothetical protein